MHIDDFKKDEFWVNPATDASYDSREAFIIEGMFGFCGCGSPSDALQYIHDTLRSIKALRDGDDLKREKWDRFYTNWKTESRKLHGSTGAEYFIYYVFDQMELIEHGGSVPGWLTEEGQALLDDLDEMDNLPDDQPAISEKLHDSAKTKPNFLN